mgnify:CR=1 FL=1
MKTFYRLRNFRNASSRSTLIVASVAWLGFLLQPCVMAAPVAGAADSSGAIELSIVTHHGPGMPAEQCMHCGDGATTRNLLPESCDESSAASQSPSAKLPDADGDNWSPAVPVAINPEALRNIAPSKSAPRAEQLPRSVPFTVAYCVYLE